MQTKHTVMQPVMFPQYVDKAGCKQEKRYFSFDSCSGDQFDTSTVTY